MERRFHCTACGKCCYGWLPLTLDDALAHAGRFPLAMILSTVRQGAKAYEITARLGTTVTIGRRKRVAVRAAPTAYIPPSFSCPALASDGRCAIHRDKPVRCRTMPFSAYQEERDQDKLLVPRKGWECDTSPEAPAVYRDKGVIDRQDFDRERRVLTEQASILGAYTNGLMANAPNVAAAVTRAAGKKGGGHVILKFTTILSRIEQADVAGFCEKQLPVLKNFAGRSAENPQVEEYHQFYRDAAAAMERFLQRC